MNRLTFSCYSAIVTIEWTNGDALHEIRRRLPPHSRIIDAHPGNAHVHVLVRPQSETDTWCVSGGAFPNVRGCSVSQAVDEVVDRLDIAVSEAASEYVFVHAGAVAWRGRGVVIPGPSHAGKTSLVRALVEAGATYYSDEFAVFDFNGRLHPYARPLAIRDAEGTVSRVTAQELAGVTGALAVEPGLIVAARFVSGSTWDPKKLTPGQTTLKLFENAIRARDLAEPVLAALAKVARMADGVESERGDAAETARLLLLSVST